MNANGLASLSDQASRVITHLFRCILPAVPKRKRSLDQQTITTSVAAYTELGQLTTFFQVR